MSKCDVRIEFDHADRTFQGGDEVTGHVIIQVSDSVKCDGLKLERYWQAHGRGNRSRGGEYSGILFEGEWQGGQTYRYPFKFQAPRSPVTYRGHYVNIDHYVHTRVSIPWAFDPKATEEIIVIPGPNGRDEAEFATEAPQIFKSATGGQKNVGMIIGIVMIVAGLLFFPCGIPVSIVGIVILFFGMRNTMAEKKVGQVEVTVEQDVSPGQTIPVNMTMAAAQDATINAVTAKLIGKEIAVSGSGTNRSTHTHKFHEEEIVLRHGDAGNLANIEGVIQMPRTQAYSFSAGDNKIVWEVEFRVDIPKWPDWVEKRQLVVRPLLGDAPPEVAAAQQQTSAQPPAHPVADIAAIVTQAAAPSAPSDPAPEPTPAPMIPEEPEPAIEPPSQDFGSEPDSGEPIGQPTDTAATIDVLGVIEQLSSADRFSGEIEQIVEANEANVFAMTATIDKVESTFGFDMGDDYRNGKTIIGTIVGSDRSINVRFPDSRNDELESLEKGDMVELSGVIIKWDTLYDRVNLEAR